MVEQDAAGIGPIETGEMAEKGGFAATAGTQQKEKFPSLDAEVDGVQGDGRAELLGQVFNGDRDHKRVKGKVGSSNVGSKRWNVTE